jgi:site-specific recombinase XerD
MGKVIIKNKRKNFLKDGECEICKNCTDRTACNERIGYEKCQKCRDCKVECLKYCDRFRCYERFQAQGYINGKHTVLATERRKKDAEAKRIDKLALVNSGKYVNKSQITLLEMIELADRSKYANTNIGESSLIRNTETLNNLIESHLHILNKPVQKITSNDIHTILNSKVYYAQATIEKFYYSIKSGIDKAIEDNIIVENNNPMKKIKPPNSEIATKEVVPFELEEERLILEYISSNEYDKNRHRNKADSQTLKNCLKFLFATGTRAGEACSVNNTTDINFKSENIIIHTTLSKHIEKDEKGNIICNTDKTTKKRKLNKVIGINNTTKTGRKLRMRKKIEKRILPFVIANEQDMKKLLEEQLVISKSNPNNINNFLFCNKDGTPITAQQLTSFLKLLCRDLGIKTELKTGCSIHMTKHTFVTRCIESHISLKVISTLVGTSVQRLEKTYAHILDKFRNEELQLLNNYYSKNNISLNGKVKLQENKLNTNLTH